MKTIIVGTDFTASSTNACKYAAFLAIKLNCKLTIFNMIESPFVHSNVGLYGLTYTTVKTNSQQKVNKLVNELSKLFPTIEINHFVSIDDFKEELKKFVLSHQVKVVVMGLETKDKISKFIYGSHGVSIAGKIDAPVIIVPQSYKTHQLLKTVLAVDNREKLHQSSLKEFEVFVKEINSELNLLHVKTEDEIFNSQKISSLKINDEDLPIQIISAKDIQDGLKKFSLASNIDLVVIISKKHSIFHNLFSESTTKKIAFISKVPMMSINE